MRIAFIGGNGHHYIRGLLTDPPPGLDFTVAVASDGVDAAAARKLAGNLPSATWFDDPVRMLDQFKPEILSIGAVYAYNGAWCEEALQRDIPTVSDKPIATTWERLNRLKELTAGTQRILLSEFDFRARAEVRAARDAVAAGLIGQVVLMTAQKSYRFGTRAAWYRRRETYGGTLMWVASHGIDAIPFITGRRLCAVFGHQSNVSRPDYQEMEDHCVSVFELDNSATAVVHGDFLRPVAAATHADDRFRIAGSQGVIEIRDGHCTLTTHDQAETDITSRVCVEPMARELLAALRDGKREYFSTEASLRTAEILLTARDAADCRQRIEIPA